MMGSEQQKTYNEIRSVIDGAKRTQYSTMNIVRDHIDVIDKKCGEGLSIQDIYNELCNKKIISVSLGTFRKYVSIARSENK